MKLKQKDKKILLDAGYFKCDLKQIEEAAEKTKYTHDTGKKENIISQAKAIKLLGRKNFLISLGRSTFHLHTNCEVKNRKNNEIVCFDTSSDGCHT